MRSASPAWTMKTRMTLALISAAVFALGREAPTWVALPLIILIVCITYNMGEIQP